MMNASECRRGAKEKAYRAPAAADQPEASPMAAPRRAAGVLVAMIPVFTTFIIALAVVSSIVAGCYFEVTGSLSLSAAHLQADSVKVTDPHATFTISTAGTKGSASQVPVAEPTPTHVCT